MFFKYNSEKNPIDVMNPTSFPNQFQDTILSCLDSMSSKDLQELRNHVPRNEYTVDDFLNRWFGISKNFDFYKEVLIPIFDQYDLICFHATRVKSKADILENGLNTNIEEYKDRMREALQKYRVPHEKAELAMKYICDEYKRKYGNSSYPLCFFTSLSSFYHKDGMPGYEQYCKTVGGELAEWALRKHCPEVLEVLHNNGYPVIVEFLTSFCSIKCSHKARLIFPFVINVVSKALWNYNYVIEADGAIIGNITPERIRRIIPSENLLSENNNR